MRGVLVCIVGIDGSGKTTLAKRLVQEMQARGTRSRYVWGGFAPTVLLRPILWLTKRLVYRRERDTEISESKGQVLKNRWASVLYHYVVLADYVLQMLARVALPLGCGWNVVCDRYVHDIVVNTALVLDYSDEGLLRLLAGIQRLVPRPDRVLWADVPEEVAYARRDDVLSMAFLGERRRRYRLVAEARGLPVLDTRQPADMLFANVAAELANLLKDSHADAGNWH